jgi:DNA-binding GntR family transcriptional regulator
VSLTSDDERLEYVKIANDLREQILTGRLVPGDKLPTARQLMKAHGVATHTVTSALRVLQAENLTYSVHGRGTYVREDLDVGARLEDDARPRSGTDGTAELREAVDRIESKLDQLIDEIAAIRRRLGD